MKMNKSKYETLWKTKRLIDSQILAYQLEHTPYIKKYKPLCVCCKKVELELDDAIYATASNIAEEENTEVAMVHPFLLEENVYYNGLIFKSRNNYIALCGGCITELEDDHLLFNSITAISRLRVKFEDDLITGESDISKLTP